MWSYFNKYKLYLILLSIFGITALTYFECADRTKLERFRRTDTPISSAEIVSTLGLKELNLSGSARIKAKVLKNALKDVQMPVYVFDLQLEKHLYIDGLPLHWYGLDEQEGKSTKLKHKIRLFLHTGSFKFNKNDVQTEEDLIKGIGFHYVKTNQTRHRVPVDEQVDTFIQTLLSIPQNSWVHMHCSAGQGRTSIGMVCYDILKNGKNVSLEDIVKRQHILGSEDLFDTQVWENGTYTKEMLETRKHFIQLFYQYINDPKGFGHQSWTKWRKNHKGEIGTWGV